MKIKYDFHIHTCLSPCGDDEATPNNVVNMAMLKGLDAIAITDHNTVKNCEACIEVGKKNGVLVLCGMELTTSEDIHVVCLFRNLEGGRKFESYINSTSFKIENDKNIFGNQNVLDCNDEFVEEVPHLLITATTVGIYDVVKLAEKYNGIAFPAHIDKESNSAIAILGGLDKHMGFKACEVSKKCEEKFLQDNDILANYNILSSSDAHYIVDIFESEEASFLEVESLTAESVFASILKV